MQLTVYRYGNHPKTGHWFSFMLYPQFHTYGQSQHVGGKNLYEYQIKVNSPLIFDVHRCFTPSFPIDLYKEYVGNPDEAYHIKRSEYEAELASILINRGYDSVIFRNADCSQYGMTNKEDFIELWLLKNIDKYWNYAREIK